MKRLGFLLGLAIATPLFGVDYRALRAQFDDLMFRDGELAQDAAAVARRKQDELAETDARAKAQLAAEQAMIAFDAERRAQGKPTTPPPRREVIVGPGPEGRLVKGGPDIFHPGANVLEARPPAPEGFVWLFPGDPTDLRLARKDPPGIVRSQDRRRFELESVLRATAAYPFLTDKQDPRRAQFDRFLRDHSEMPLFKTLFSLTRWPELAAFECAQLNRW